MNEFFSLITDPLLQIPRRDMLKYSLAVVHELFDPLKSSYDDVFRGTESLATILLCETLLSLLPSMSVRDMPYKLLKAYEIAPLGQGVISQHNRIVLFQCAVVDNRDILHVPRPLFHRVFLPLVEVPSHARKQVVGMMAFLDAVRVCSGKQLANKAATVLVEQWLDELVRSGQVSVIHCRFQMGLACTKQVPTRSIMRQPNSLVRRGLNIHSVISSHVYVRQVFNVEVLPRWHRSSSFFKAALGLCDEELLFDSLAEELQKKALFVPRAILHESQGHFSPTSFQVLSSITLGYLLAQCRSRTLTPEECQPLLSGVQVTLLSELRITFPQSKQLTRYF